MAWESCNKAVASWEVEGMLGYAGGVNRTSGMTTIRIQSPHSPGKQRNKPS